MKTEEPITKFEIVALCLLFAAFAFMVADHYFPF